MGPASRSKRHILQSGVIVVTAAFATTVALAQAPRPRPRTRPTPRATATASPTATATTAPTAAPTKARTLAITHEEMGCVIVGKFPEFTACFDPTTDLAAADFYFKAHNHKIWYRVPFKAEGKCHKATLPAPGKALKDTTMMAYASGASRQFGEARTQEYALKIVDSEGACKGEKPVAPYVPSASVTVFPSLPTGFAAAAGAPAAVAGGGLPILPIAGGAAVVGGGAAAAFGAFGGNNGGTDGAKGTDGGPVNTPTPTATPIPNVPTPTPTPRPSTNLPPNVECRTNPSPASGNIPLTVEFNMCRSEDPEGRPLTFTFDFGDGGRSSGNFCRESHTYTVEGTFRARLCAADDVPSNERCCPTIDVKPMVPTPVPYKIYGERMAVASTLEVPGAMAQVVMDDTQVAYPAEGTAYLVARARRGEVRFDGQIVSAKGQPGRWRFDLAQTEPMIPGTLRVIHGKVLELKADSVVFALQGKAGERVSFTFETWR